MEAAELIAKLSVCESDARVVLVGPDGAVFHDFTPLKYKDDPTIYIVPVFKRDATHNPTTAIPRSD